MSHEQMQSAQQQQQQQQYAAAAAAAAAATAAAAAGSSTGKRKKEGKGAGEGSESGNGRWTDAEHALFLKGIRKYGNSSWKMVASLVGTRTAEQVRSHAHRFLKKSQGAKGVARTDSASDLETPPQDADRPAGDEAAAQNLLTLASRSGSRSHSPSLPPSFSASALSALVSASSSPLHHGAHMTAVQPADALALEAPHPTGPPPALVALHLGEPAGDAGASASANAAAQQRVQPSPAVPNNLPTAAPLLPSSEAGEAASHGAQSPTVAMVGVDAA